LVSPAFRKIGRLSEQKNLSVPSPDPCDPDTPPPLSPIEELEDDAESMRWRPRSDPWCRASTSGTPPTSVGLDSPILEEADRSFESRADLLFSRQHLQSILDDPALTVKFTEFLSTYRPDSVAILAYYLNAAKALKSILYAESIMKYLEPIPGHGFTTSANNATLPFSKF